MKERGGGRRKKEGKICEKGSEKKEKRKKKEPGEGKIKGERLKEDYFTQRKNERNETAREGT